MNYLQERTANENSWEKRRVASKSSNAIWASLANTMKPQVDDIEDDLAAEEENKLINEVSERVPHGSCMLTHKILRNTKFGEEYA